MYAMLDKRHESLLRNPMYRRRLKESSGAQRSKNRAMAAEALRLVNLSTTAAGVDQPPTDLHQLAQYLGVREIRYVPLAMRGRLIIDDKELVVEVNEELEGVDRQRCVAHELAHVVLERERIKLAIASERNADRSISHSLIEKLCDLCGDEIVLPREWLHKQLLIAGSSLVSIVEIASRAILPVDFVVTRIIDLELRPWRAIWWMRHDGKFQIGKSVPHWDDTFLVWIDLVDGPTSPVFKCWETRTMTEGELTLRIDGEEHQYAVECVRSDDSTVLSIVYTQGR
jgi:Zn-dependent peptidase ImmA (M78 family)